MAKGRLDVTLISADFPLRGVGTGERAQKAAIMRDLVDWLSDVVPELPARTIPILCTDNNDRFGMHRVESSWVQSHEYCESFGPIADEKEGQTAIATRKFATLAHLVFVTTYFDAGPTFF